MSDGFEDVLNVYRFQNSEINNQLQMRSCLSFLQDSSGSKYFLVWEEKIDFHSGIGAHNRVSSQNETQHFLNGKVYYFYGQDLTLIHSICATYQKSI